MGMLWRMVKWGTAAMGVYYVWQNFVRPEMQRARVPQTSGTTTMPGPTVGDVAPT